MKCRLTINTNRIENFVQIWTALNSSFLDTPTKAFGGNVIKNNFKQLYLLYVTISVVFEVRVSAYRGYAFVNIATP